MVAQHLEMCEQCTTLAMAEFEIKAAFDYCTEPTLHQSRTRTRYSNSLWSRIANYSGTLAAWLKYAKVIIPAVFTVCLIILIAGYLNQQRDEVRDMGEATRALRIYKKAPTGAVELDDQAIVGNHELLQILFAPEQAAYAAILSIDDQHQVSYLYPRSSEQPMAIYAADVNKEMVLPFSFNLEDTLSFERFFLLQADHLFDLQAIVLEIQTQVDMTKPPIQEINDVKIDSIILFMEKK